MSLSPVQLDRAIGAVVASAAGDALGSQYEFGPSIADATPVAFGVGHFGHGVGEWTDDTSMAVPILQALADGRSLDDPRVLGDVVVAWRDWAQTALDVGAQTAAVLGRVGAGLVSESDAGAASEELHRRQGRSGGNGALMRTGPLALGYLDRPAADLAAAAGRVARLTHWEDDNADACALWCLAIRHAALTGEFDVRAQLSALPADRRARWAAFIDEALEPGRHPRDFAEQNGWVVRALQGALAAITGATSLVDVLERAVRGGADTDTVAAIAGSLGGAVYGMSALPPEWVAILHGWPGIDADELARLATHAAQN